MFSSIRCCFSELFEFDISPSSIIFLHAWKGHLGSNFLYTNPFYKIPADGFYLRPPAILYQWVGGKCRLNIILIEDFPAFVCIVEMVNTRHYFNVRPSLVLNDPWGLSYHLQDTNFIIPTFIYQSDSQLVAQPWYL